MESIGLLEIIYFTGVGWALMYINFSVYKNRPVNFTMAISIQILAVVWPVVLFMVIVEIGVNSINSILKKKGNKKL